MGNRTRLGASVVGLAAAVAISVSAAYAGMLHVVSSFPVSTTNPPYARGIYWSYSGVHAILYSPPADNYLYTFTTTGSLISTTVLSNAMKLGDADRPPPGYSGFGVVDEGSHELKVYTTAGSYVGVARSLPADVVGYAYEFWTIPYWYLGTSSGTVYRYVSSWSLVNSFATNTAMNDLAAGFGYEGGWGDWVYVGASASPYVKVYYGTGYAYGSFSLPGAYSCGAVYSGQNRTTMWCIRNIGTQRWAFEIDTGGLMAVQPASLGRVKTVFR